MTTIAVDIDDTLYSFGQLAREVFIDLALEEGDKRMQRGAYCAWGEWRSPSDVTDVDTWMKVIARCHTDENILSQVPFPGAAGVLQELVDHSYHLLYISNRTPDAEPATQEWLQDNYFPLEQTRLVCTTDDKMRKMGQCQYLIDDRPKTLVQFVYDFHWKHKHGSENAKKARKAFGLYTPYNAALTDVPEVKLAPNWKLLRQYLLDENVLPSPLPEELIGCS